MQTLRDDVAIIIKETKIKRMAKFRYGNEKLVNNKILIHAVLLFESRTIFGSALVRAFFDNKNKL